MNHKAKNQKAFTPVQWRALLPASLRAFVIFIIQNIILEYLMSAVLEIDIKAMLPRTDFGPHFLLRYYGLFYLLVTLMLLTVAVSRPLFRSTLTATAAVGLLYCLFSGLLLLQLVNLQVVPGILFWIMSVSNAIELPLVLWIGVGAYTAAIEKRPSR